MLVISVVIMASTLVCRGSIIVTWLDQPIEVGGWWNPSTPQSVDINGDGVFNFSFVGDQSFVGFRSEDVNRYFIIPDLPPNIGGAVAALNEGYFIGPDSGNASMDWFNHTGWASLMTQYDTGRAGEFWKTPDAWGPPWDPRSPPELRTYIGVEFLIDSATHYGWIEVQGHWSYPYAMVWGWAYESTPGMPIAAGAIPEPTTLSLLGIGAAALLFRKIANNRPHPTPHKCGEGGP